MSSDALQEIIAVGHDLVAMKYYKTAAAIVFFYDFFLTLGDEVKFAWRGRKSWVFVLFLVNRYLPMGYQFWLAYIYFSPTFPKQVCDKTAFFSAVTFVGTTLLAQIALTLRIYAVTSRNFMIASFFGLITVSQLGLGFYWCVFLALQAPLPIPPIPLEAYRICVFGRHRPLEIGITTISLTYDLLAFLIIVFVAARTNMYKLPMSSLFKTLARDATYYFLIIFTSHFVLEMALLFGSPTIQLLPAIGNIVYLPVMVTRLLLSLKKATSSREYVWSLGEPTVHTMGFAGTTGDEIRLDTLRLDPLASTDDEVSSQR